MSRKDLLLKIILPFIIVAVAIIVTIALIRVRSVPQRVTRTYSGPLVEVMAIERTKREVSIPGTGTVQPTQQAEIIPQVSGKVMDVSPEMVEGGFFNRGERMFTIEKVDYELALERARAGLAQAELELNRNQSLAEIARLEWKRIEKNENNQPNPLTLYEPQLKAAEAQVASAKSAVSQAELDLSRTVIRAPFNCYIRSEQVDIGQYVRAGSTVASVAGTDAVEIVVPLQIEEMSWLNIPQTGKEREGSQATVKLVVGEEEQTWTGAVVRSYGEIDPLNRMAKVVVAVEDPFGKKVVNGEDVPRLAPGMFVEVLLHGTVLADVMAIPRAAVRDNDTVWIVDDSNKLQIRPIVIIRRERDEVLVRSGIEAGDQLILTGLGAVADGMLVRPQVREAGQ